MPMATGSMTMVMPSGSDMTVQITTTSAVRSAR